MNCVNEVRWKSGVLRTSLRGGFWCMWAKWAVRQYSWSAHKGLRSLEFTGVIFYIIGGLFRVTLVVDWWFLPKILGRASEGHLPLCETICSHNSTWRWLGHLNTLWNNRTCFNFLHWEAVGSKKRKFALVQKVTSHQSEIIHFLFFV